MLVIRSGGVEQQSCAGNGDGLFFDRRALHASGAFKGEAPDATGRTSRENYVWGELVTATPQLVGERDIRVSATAPSTVLGGLPFVAAPEDSADPRALLVRYQRMALVADLGSALFGAVFALVVRFGGNPPALHLILSGVIPLVWVGVVAAQRGYERRFLGTGPEESVT